MSVDKGEIVEELLTNIIEASEKVLNDTAEPDHIEQEEQSNQTENLVRKATTSTSGETIVETAIDTKAVEIGGEKGATTFRNIERPGDIEQIEVLYPTFSPPINLNNTHVQVTSPIILIEVKWEDLKVKTESVHLEKGIYKIEYTINNLEPFCGLGLFNLKKEFKQILVYHRSLFNPPPIVHESGHFYLELKEANLIALTNGDGFYRPYNFRGLISVTIHKYKTSPN